MPKGSVRNAAAVLALNGFADRQNKVHVAVRGPGQPALRRDLRHRDGHAGAGPGHGDGGAGVPDAARFRSLLDHRRC